MPSFVHMIAEICPVRWKIESSGRWTRSLQYMTCGRVTGWAAFGVFSRHLFLLGNILEWYSNILRMAQEVNCQHSLRSNICIIVSSKLVKLTLERQRDCIVKRHTYNISLLRTVTYTSHFSGSIICGNSMRSMRILQSTCRAPILCLMALIYLAQVSIPILKVRFGPVRVFWRDHTGICMHSDTGFMKLRTFLCSKFHLRAVVPPPILTRPSLAFQCQGSCYRKFHPEEIMSTRSYLGWTTHSNTSTSFRLCQMVLQMFAKSFNDAHNLFLMENRLDNGALAPPGWGPPAVRTGSPNGHYLVYMRWLKSGVPPDSRYFHNPNGATL